MIVNVFRWKQWIPLDNLHLSSYWFCLMLRENKTDSFYLLLSEWIYEWLHFALESMDFGMVQWNFIFNGWDNYLLPMEYSINSYYYTYVRKYSLVLYVKVIEELQALCNYLWNVYFEVNFFLFLSTKVHLFVRWFSL